jgi:hypothetical protein
MILELAMHGGRPRRILTLAVVLISAVFLTISAAGAQDYACAPTTAQSTTLPAPGYRLPDGDFIPRADVQPSPDDRFWLCSARKGLPGFLLAPPIPMP